MKRIISNSIITKYDLKSFFDKFVMITILLFFLKPDLLKAQIFTKMSVPVDANPSAGCAWIDFDNNGKLDAYLSHFNTDCILYSNKDGGNFDEIKNGSLSPGGNNFSGIAWGDYDNDGLADLYVTSMTGTNAFFRNAGNGKFVRITNSATTAVSGSFLSCNWVDYDNDGYLDLFITASGTGFIPGAGNYNLLFKNNGDGTFKKVTDMLLATQKTYSSCAAFADYDNDGDLDVFLTEWGKDNWLFENNGDGTFSAIKGTAVNSNKNISITCSWGDYDNDGFLDLFVGNGSTSTTVKQENYLFHNNGDKTFTKITSGDIADYKGCVWSSAWGDVDNDGDLDLYVGTIYEKEELLYINNGDGTFTLKHEFGINNSANGTGITGASFGDYDNDGALDILLADASGEGPILYHNNGNSNNWINILCTGKISNASAIGTRVKIKANIFGKPYWQMRDIVGVQGFRGSDDLRVHFGLGDAAVIDSLIISWPSKQQTVLTNLPVNQFLSVEETIPSGYMKVNFLSDEVSGYSPLTVNFKDISICDPAKPINKWSWDFNGDGAEDSNVKNPSFLFDSYEGNNYNVSLTVSNSERSITITKENLIKLFPLAQQNLALKKTLTASSYIAYHTISLANDGSALSYWNSTAADSQWLKVELDSIYSVGKIIINWASTWATQYSLLYSLDDVNWTQIFSENNSDGNIDEMILNPIKAKYILINMTLASYVSRGIGIKEIEIYRPEKITSVTNDVILPESFALYQNYPNPFNPSTIIKYSVPYVETLHATSLQQVVLKVYDVIGREITTLVDEQKSPGKYEVQFNGSSLASGVYFYQLKSGSFIQSKKMLVLK